MAPILFAHAPASPAAAAAELLLGSLASVLRRQLEAGGAMADAAHTLVGVVATGLGPAGAALLVTLGAVVVVPVLTTLLATLATASRTSGTT